MNIAAITGATVTDHGYDLQQLRDLATKALDASGLAFNDYGLNNLVMHLAVMLDRVEGGHDMPGSVVAETLTSSPELVAAQHICADAHVSYGLDIEETDVYYLSLVIKASTKRRTVASIAAGVGPELDDRDWSIARTAADQVARTYCLDAFSEDFIGQLATHIHALLRRASDDTFIYNPLATQVRDEYPLVHDMAVVLAEVVAREGGIPMTEDEIAFFTFHLGGYFHNNAGGDERVTVAVLYINYYQFQQEMLARLVRAFGDEIEIVAVESVSAYTPGSLDCDVIVTQLPVEVTQECQCVVVGPLFGQLEEGRVRKAVETAQASKRSKSMSQALRAYLREDLFRMEWYPGDRVETIAAIVSDCIDKGLVEEGYFDEVMRREELSPTAFNNLVAIPHALTPSALQSFLYLVVNQRPMTWGNQQVNIILLLGISNDNRQSFTELYSDFITLLCDPSNAAEVMRASSYPDLVRRLQDRITRLHTKT